MDMRIKWILLTGLLMALTCPTSCDEDATEQGTTSVPLETETSPSISISATTDPQTEASTPEPVDEETTSTPPQPNDPSTSTMPEESESTFVSAESEASSTDARTATTLPPTTITTTLAPTTTTTTLAATATTTTTIPSTTTTLSTATPGDEPESTTPEEPQDSHEGGSGDGVTSFTSTATSLADDERDTTTERVTNPPVQSTTPAEAEMAEAPSTSVVEETTTAETTRNIVTTAGISTTLGVQTNEPHQSTAAPEDASSEVSADDSATSSSEGEQTSGSSVTTSPRTQSPDAQQTTTQTEDLTTTTESSKTFLPTAASILYANETSLPGEDHTTEELPKTSKTAGQSYSSEDLMHHYLVSVVLCVIFINIIFCLLTSFCVYRIVTKHHFYSWDPPPIRYGSVDYGISMGRRNMGLDLSSEAPLDGIATPPPPRTTHEQLQLKNRDSGIPIVITNEDGWCVPYSEDQGRRPQVAVEEEGEHSQGRPRKTNGSASNRTDVDTGL